MQSKLERRLLIRRPSIQGAPALFLDRDGVVIEDQHHICDPKDVQLCPGAQELLQAATTRGWPVVVITNQSGIARGYFNWAAYASVTERVLELLGPEAPLTAVYANGHGPDAPSSSWRKPSPGMLIAASKDLKLDLSRSLLVGDRLSDLQAGARAGLHWLAHVETGHGHQERAAVQSWYSLNRGPYGEAAEVDLAKLETLHDFPLQRLQPLL